MMEVRNINGGSLISVLQDYLLYGFAYHDWIEEEDSEWSDKGGRADQPDGVDDGHEDHYRGIFDCYSSSTELFSNIYSMDLPTMIG